MKKRPEPKTLPKRTKNPHIEALFARSKKAIQKLRRATD